MSRDTNAALTVPADSRQPVAGIGNRVLEGLCVAFADEIPLAFPRCHHVGDAGINERPREYIVEFIADGVDMVLRQRRHPQLPHHTNGSNHSKQSGSSGVLRHKI
ncbi:MAG: hypothetical protein OXF51_08220 [Alphaproteobacteria bacterium]|nr:hypothetical protein [Alphaproteobacteria bacterium]